MSKEWSHILKQVQNNNISVFLTHVGIWQMPTWLPTWKAKSFYRVGNFLPTWFFLPLRKFRTIKIKLEKNSYIQTNACLLHISRNFKDIFKYICFTLYLQQTVNNWESVIIFIDHCCLPCFFFQQILDPISLEYIWSNNDLASILRHYCSLLYINSMPNMRILVTFLMFLSVRALAIC